ncbi:MAG: ComEC/Rec2 family competence protein [Verrucomicrobia bacterium]|nr:ComEC/Rec2 family competence protein [Verrucomicrobiota bacterium]
MKRPLLPVALLLAAGIVLANFVEVSLLPLFAAAWLLSTLALAWPRMRTLLLVPAVFLAGWVNLTWRTAVLSPCDLRVLVGEQAALVTLRGVIGGTPSQRVTLRDEEEVWRTLVTLEVTELRVGQQPWQPARGTVQTRTKGLCLTNLFHGQPVEVSGVCESPPGPVAPGLFDYRTHLKRLGIHHQLRVSGESEWTALGRTNPPPWTERFRTWAQQTLSRGLPEVDEPLRLQWAMVLGWKTALTGEVSEPFMRSGTMHIFAISGLHIALIAGILLALFRLFNVPRSACGAVVIPLIWFYTAATEWQASAIRSTVMMTIIIAGWALRRPTDLGNSLAGAAFVILLWDPLQLFQASFQLSFGAVMSIALLLPVLEDARRRLVKTDPFLPPTLRSRWERFAYWSANHLTKALATSLAACLGTAPLIACYFHLFTPVSLFANLAVVPLSGLALMSGLGSVICGDWLPWAGELFNHSGWFFMLCMVKASEWATQLPAAYAYVAAPSWLTMGLYYLLLLAPPAGWFSGKLRWWTIGAIGLLAAAWFGSWLHTRAATRVTILPLRGGFGAWVDAPGRRGDWLIDCGGVAAVEMVTTPFLRAEGVNTLPRLALTHGDVLHVGGGTNLMRCFEIGQFCTGPLWFRSLPYRQVVAAWTNQPAPITKLQAGDRLGSWTVVHPQAQDRFPTADDNSLVLRGEWGGRRLLLCADLGPAGQRALWQRAADLRADIVVSGLPKDGEPLQDALLDRIRPRLIIVADAEVPAFEQAGLALKRRLGRRPTPVIFLRESRAVVLEFRGGHWKARGLEGEVERGE